MNEWYGGKESKTGVKSHLRSRRLYIDVTRDLFLASRVFESQDICQDCE